jgi:hypothetical protein
MSAAETINDPDLAARSSASSALATLRDWLATSAGADHAFAIVPTADSPEFLAQQAVGGPNTTDNAQDEATPVTNPWVTHSADGQATVIAEMVADLEISTHGGAAGPIEAPMPSRADDGHPAERLAVIDATTGEPVDGNKAGSASEPAEPASLTDTPDSNPGEGEQIIDLQQLVAGRVPGKDDAGADKVLMIAALHDIDPGGQEGNQAGELVASGRADAASAFAKPDAVLGVAATAGAELALPDLKAEADSDHLPKMLNEHFAAADLVADQPAPADGAPVPEQPQTVIPSSGAYFVDVVALARYGVSNADMVNAVFAGQEHQLQH